MVAGAVAFMELEDFLRSKEVIMTPEEADLLSRCNSKASANGLCGFAFGSAIAWTATRRLIPLMLNPLLRVGLTVGSGLACGVWRTFKSYDSSADHILALYRSRMQKELAIIMARKYHHDPGTKRLLDRHFYSERVFDDSTSDRPILRLCYRNSFRDVAADGQLTHETDIHSGRSPQLDDYDSNRNTGNNSYGNPQNDSKTHSVNFPSDSGIKRADSELKRNSVSKATSLFSRVNYGVDVIGDPLDCIFGGMMAKEEICHPVNKVPPQSHRRSRRKRRMRQLEVPFNT